MLLQKDSGAPWVNRRQGDDAEGLAAPSPFWYSGLRLYMLAKSDGR